MNKQRKVLITTTYNEMGIIIDTKAEEVTQPNLQPTCNKLATDTISRQAAIDALGERPLVWDEWADEYSLGQRNQYDADKSAIEALPSAQPERIRARWEKQVLGWKCSNCMASTNDFGAREFNFCPECGADMRGGR